MMDFSSLVKPPGNGSDPMSQMMQIATMAQSDPGGLAKIMAAQGVPAPAPPPVGVKALADITPQKGASMPAPAMPMPAPAPAMPMPGIPMAQPQVTGQQIQAAAPPLTPANMAPGFNFGALSQALGSLKMPEQAPAPDVQFAPSTPVRQGGQVDPALLQQIIALMGAGQGQQPSGAGLGGLIAGMPK